MPPVPPRNELGQPSINKDAAKWVSTIGAGLCIVIILAAIIVAGVRDFPETRPPEVQTAQAQNGWRVHVNRIENIGPTLHWSDDQPASQADHRWVAVYLTVENYTSETEVFGHWRVSMRDSSGQEWYASGRGDALSFSEFRGLSNPDKWLIVSATAKYVIVFDASIDIASAKVYVDGQEVR